MDSQLNSEQRIMSAPLTPQEMVMLSKQRWEDVRQMHAQGVSTSEIARRLEVDRKTVRKALREPWRAYSRAQREDTLLAVHAGFLRQRAEQVGYSAKILYQELCQDRSYQGSYETVKRFVAPLREQAAVAADLC
jgi:transposase